MHKSALRKKFYAIRKQTAAHATNAAKEAVSQLSAHALFANSHHIACYLAFRDEIDTLPLIRAIWQSNKICYLPILQTTRALKFAQYHEGDLLKPNQFSILEPENNASMIDPMRLDLVIMPLVAYDKTGNRLGTGGGYYDRTFAFKKTHPHQKPCLLGFTYASQEAMGLPHDPWDILLDGVVTEKTVHLFNRSATFRSPPP